ncbi:MAG: hypothetical protein Q9160_001568 [Pyrenula sp. 1 TL-2023]
MGIEMHTSQSHGGVSPSEPADIDLLDAPDVKADSTEDTTSQTSATSADRNEVAANGHMSINIKLEDMFNDDDDDDEFPTSSGTEKDLPSSPPQTHTSAAASSPPSQAIAAKYTDPEIMYAFYQRLFPFRLLFLWLNHHPKPSPDFSNREFAFTLQNDAYLRYQSFPSADLLRRDILKLNPSRFEIGPVYTTNPRDRKTLRKASAFKPLSKEIVFDLDLTDYDDIRSCCRDKAICAKCWTFVTMAIRVVDAALRDDFGFNHIMWVYSGRRGAHAWISDRAARDLDDDKRRALAGYLEVIKGGAQGGKRVNVRRPLHPHLQRSIEILKPFFATILADQEPFLSPEGSERLLRLLPDKPLNDALRKKWSSSPNRPSVRKWADIDALAATGVSKTLDTRQLMEAKQDVLLEYAYPRLDVAVSKHRNHLLKSPFVVHPGTGRVCVPITADASAAGDTATAADKNEGSIGDVDAFDPLSVPTVTQLLGELDTFKGNDANGTTNGDAMNANDAAFIEDGRTMRRLADFEKTSLKPYVQIFERFVRGVVREEQQKGVKRERDEGEGDVMEF